MRPGSRRHDYDRREFGRTLTPLSNHVYGRGAVVRLASHTGINKGTVSHIRTGDRSCTLACRRAILDDMREQLPDRPDDIERLAVAAGLYGPAGRASDPSPATLTRDHEAGCAYYHHNDVPRALAWFTSVRDRAAESGQHEVALRAWVNIVHCHFGLDDLRTASRELGALITRAKQLGAVRIVAEALQCEGRIAIRREKYGLARERLRESDRLLANEPAYAGEEAPGGGHSYVVPSTTQIPANAIRTGNRHFWAKAAVLELEQHLGLTTDLATDAYDSLRGAYGLDKRLGGGGVPGFDLLWLARAKLAVDPSAIRMAIRCVDESAEFLTGAIGRRNRCLERARLAMLGGRPEREARQWLERAVSECRVWAPPGLASVYDAWRAVHEHYQRRGWRRDALGFAYAAARLQFYPYYVGRLRLAATGMPCAAVLPAIDDDIEAGRGAFALLGRLGGRQSRMFVANAGSGWRSALRISRG